MILDVLKKSSVTKNPVRCDDTRLSDIQQIAIHRVNEENALFTFCPTFQFYNVMLGVILIVVTAFHVMLPDVISPPGACTIKLFTAVICGFSQ